MNYLKKNVLLSTECIKIEPQKNPIFLVIKWIWGILGFWLLLIPTIKAINATIKYKTTEYLITDKRVMEKYGWISTHTDEMLLNKVENITVSYSFWGKIFNYGTIRFQGTNRNDVIFFYIKNAETIKKQFNELL
ncbi:MAG: PH domain-containing protein [Clostridia bacterium]|nr:PH domain-containing protein [Clostridia bacterium]